MAETTEEEKFPAPATFSSALEALGWLVAREWWLQQRAEKKAKEAVDGVRPKEADRPA